MCGECHQHSGKIKINSKTRTNQGRLLLILCWLSQGGCLVGVNKWAGFLSCWVLCITLPFSPILQGISTAFCHIYRTFPINRKTIFYYTSPGNLALWQTSKNEMDERKQLDSSSWALSLEDLCWEILKKGRCCFHFKLVTNRCKMSPGDYGGDPRKRKYREVHYHFVGTQLKAW